MYKIIKKQNSINIKQNQFNELNKNKNLFHSLSRNNIITKGEKSIINDDFICYTKDEIKKEYIQIYNILVTIIHEQNQIKLQKKSEKNNKTSEEEQLEAITQDGIQFLQQISALLLTSIKFNNKEQLSKANNIRSINLQNYDEADNDDDDNNLNYSYITARLNRFDFNIYMLILKQIEFVELNKFKVKIIFNKLLKNILNKLEVVKQLHDENISTEIVAIVDFIALHEVNEFLSIINLEAHNLNSIESWQQLKHKIADFLNQLFVFKAKKEARNKLQTITTIKDCFNKPIDNYLMNLSQIDRTKYYGIKKQIKELLTLKSENQQPNIDNLTTVFYEIIFNSLTKTYERQNISKNELNISIIDQLNKYLSSFSNNLNKFNSINKDEKEYLYKEIFDFVVKLSYRDLRSYLSNKLANVKNRNNEIIKGEIIEQINYIANNISTVDQDKLVDLRFLIMQYLANINLYDSKLFNYNESQVKYKNIIKQIIQGLDAAKQNVSYLYLLGMNVKINNIKQISLALQNIINKNKSIKQIDYNKGIKVIISDINQISASEVLDLTLLDKIKSDIEQYLNTNRLFFIKRKTNSFIAYENSFQ
jgi:hypothetical protein